MIEEGQERKCTPYIPATFGPSPVFGMDGMPRGATGYPPQGPPGPGGYPGYGPPHGAQAPPQQNYNQQNNWNGPHGPIHPVRHPFQGVCCKAQTIFKISIILPSGISTRFPSAKFSSRSVVYTSRYFT